MLSKKIQDYEKSINQKEQYIRELNEQNAAFENSMQRLMAVGTFPKNFRNPEKISSRGSFDRYKNKMVYDGEWLCTFYAPNHKECGNDKGITSSGVPVIAGKTAAIDPKHYTYGTKLFIEGYGIWECTDSGSDIKGERRVDLCTFSSHISNSGSFKAKVWIVSD